MAPNSITSWQIDGETMRQTLFSWAPKSLQMVNAGIAPWKKSYDETIQHIKKQRPYFTNKGPSSQSYGFSSSHVWMWELDNKEGWAVKNWCFQTVVLEKTLESSLECKEIKPVNPKGNQPWIFIGRTGTEAATPILWPPDAKSWLIPLMRGKIEGKRRRGQQRMRWLDSITDPMNMNFSKLWEKSGGQRSLACCNPWGSQRVRHELVTEQEHQYVLIIFIYGL